MPLYATKCKKATRAERMRKYATVSVVMLPFHQAFAKCRYVLEMIENGGTPAIATFFGFCLGAGLELPLACHLRIAADTGAKIGLPEMDLGSVPAWGGSARLPRAVGRQHALDMILRARKIDGREALAMGLDW